MRAPRARAALAALAGLAVALAAGADVRPVETVGVAPVQGTGGGAPKDAAVDEAVAAAVIRTARDVLPPDFAPPAEDGEVPVLEDWLSDVLGDDPYDYATRFQILEDRGVRRALFSDAEQEYVVRVRVHVDAERVMERLRAAGALEAAPSGGDGLRLSIVADGVSSFGAYQALVQTLRAAPAVRSATPVSFEQGRVVLAVDADREGADLLTALAAAAPPELRLIPLETTEDGGINVVVDWSAAPPAAAPGD